VNNEVLYVITELLRVVPISGVPRRELPPAFEPTEMTLIVAQGPVLMPVVAAPVDWRSTTGEGPEFFTGRFGNTSITNGSQLGYSWISD
jgi:hypothetical protein